MKVDIKAILEELKRAEVEIRSNPNFEAEILEKAKQNLKVEDVDSENGGSDGKVKKPKVLDAKETSEGKKDPNKDIPGARRIDHVADEKEAGQLNGDSKNLEKEELDKAKIYDLKEKKYIGDTENPDDEKAIESFKKEKSKKIWEKVLKKPRLKNNNKKMAKSESLDKDNMPHPKDSPEDKAHDVIEEKQPLKEALKPLKYEEQKRAFFEHLRSSRNNPNWKRDEENQKFGKKDLMSKKDKPMYKSFDDEKKEFLHKKRQKLDKKQGVPEGVDPDKMESCVRRVKSKDVDNPYAVCSASLQGKVKKSEKEILIGSLKKLEEAIKSGNQIKE